MKKALALVLALVLALSLGVSAFALELVPVTLAQVGLKPAGATPVTPLDISKVEYQLNTNEEYKNVYLVPAKGGTFYVTLDGSKVYKDINVTGTGIVSAKLVPYDADKMTGVGGTWTVLYKGEALSATITGDERYGQAVTEVQAQSAFQKGTKTYYLATADGRKLDSGDLGDNDNARINSWLAADAKRTLADAFKAMQADDTFENKLIKDDDAKKFVEVLTFDDSLVNSQAYNVALAKALTAKFKTSRFEAVRTDVKDTYVIEVTVEPNYSASYKEGSLKVEAKEAVGDPDDKGRYSSYTKVAGELKIVSDVAIFEYDMVKWAAKNEVELYATKDGDQGYSDYLTALSGYNKDEKVYKYDALELRDYPATVVSTTAFRMLRENKYSLSVVAGNNDLLVKVPEVVSGQKGVNFASYGVTYRNAKGEVTTKDDVKKVTFGFYGNQTIASDFTVEADLGIDAYELRERFGQKLEEEDIITYYIVENGKVIGQHTVDYMKDDLDEVIVFEINRKAGQTLGQYELVTEAPAAETPAEENPETGAEAIIGVVAAMAVVSVAAAAAVSLKK